MMFLACPECQFGMLHPLGQEWDKKYRLVNRLLHKDPFGEKVTGQDNDQLTMLHATLAPLPVYFAFTSSIYSNEKHKRF
jgi:hypothetical protein